MQALRRAAVPAAAARNGVTYRSFIPHRDTNILWPFWMHSPPEPYTPTFETPVWKKIFEENKVVLAWHMPSISQDRFDDIRYQFFQEDIGFKRCNKKDCHPYILKSKYRNMTRLMQPGCAVSYTNEINIKKTTKIARPFLNLELLGGCIEGELLTRNEVLKLSGITDITQVQSELIGVLSTPAYLLSAYLQKHADGPDAPAAAATPQDAAATPPDAAATAESQQKDAAVPAQQD
eukprot:scpid100128/ scgid33659/ 